jgi:hypothetical protein
MLNAPQFWIFFYCLFEVMKDHAYCHWTYAMPNYTLPDSDGCAFLNNRNAIFNEFIDLGYASTPCVRRIPLSDQ